MKVVLGSEKNEKNIVCLSKGGKMQSSGGTEVSCVYPYFEIFIELPDSTT